VISLRSIFSHPLLARELTERAARKRTYAGRVVYGLVLYVIFLVALRRLVGSAETDPTGFGVLGLGRQLFRQLIEFQCWGVLLFQPALMAGVLTYEKERDSFSLLLLTGMSPTKMLIEKYLAGLFPMATLLLLALPLGAITMGYGGVSPQLLASGAIVVLAAWLQVGAFSLLCSAWCRTTAGAMVAAYLGGALAYLAPAVGYSLAVRYVLWGADLRGLDVPEWLWSLWPPEAFARVMAFQEGEASMMRVVAYFEATGETVAATLWTRLLAGAGHRCTPILISAGVCLLLARVFVLRRAFTVAADGRRRAVRTRNAERGTRKERSRVLTSSAARWLHALWPKHADLPQDDPVAWRESGRSVLGRRGRFYYLTVLAGGLVLALSLFLLGLYPRTAGPERLYHLAVLLAGAGVVILTVQSTGALLAEHSNQTLQLLLTTPLGAPEILRQKARALRRYWVLFGVMLAIVFAFVGWSEYQYVAVDRKWIALRRYWICDALALVVYPPMIVWTSLLLALSLRARARAIMAALTIFAIWIIGLQVILSLVLGGWQDTEPHIWLSLLSPLGIVEANGQFDEVSDSYHGNPSMLYLSRPWKFIACNFIGYALVLFAVRWLCLRMAERWLRRAG